MDIMLPGIKGIDATFRLRQYGSSEPLIFVTNIAQYAVKMYEVNAFDFIVKPVQHPHFVMKLNCLMGSLGTKEYTHSHSFCRKKQAIR